MTCIFTVNRSVKKIINNKKYNLSDFNARVSVTVVIQQAFYFSFMYSQQMLDWIQKLIFLSEDTCSLCLENRTNVFPKF